jgi:hypothetical protein
MKYAVFLIGEYRCFDLLYKYYHFLYNNDCDLYVSTWSESREIDYVSLYNEIKSIKTGNIDIMKLKEKHTLKIPVTEKSFTDKFRNSICSVNDLDEFNKKNKISTDPEISNIYRTCFHYMNCLEMYNTIDKPVEFIIIIRPDMIYNIDIDKIKNNIECGTLYGHNFKKNIECIDDTIWIGDTNIIKLFIEKMYTHNEVEPQKRAANVVIENNIPYEEISNKFDIKHPSNLPIIRINMYNALKSYYDMGIEYDFNELRDIWTEAKMFVHKNFNMGI